MLTMTHPQIYALENTFADPLIVIQQELSFRVSSCSCISSHYNLSWPRAWRQTSLFGGCMGTRRVAM